MHSSTHSSGAWRNALKTAMNKKCQIPNCTNNAKILKIESKIQNGVNLNKVIFHFCDCHENTELKEFMLKKCQEKSIKSQITNPFLEIKNLIQ